jgi:hypothetical protein
VLVVLLVYMKQELQLVVVVEQLVVVELAELVLQAI